MKRWQCAIVPVSNTRDRPATAIYQSNFLPIWKWRDYLPGWIKATSPFAAGP
jgi:hypothetical protein